jgi:hypothetical protein
MHGKRDAVQLYRITNDTHSDTQNTAPRAYLVRTHMQTVKKKKEEKVEESRVVGFPSKQCVPILLLPFINEVVFIGKSIHL